MGVWVYVCVLYLTEILIFKSRLANREFSPTLIRLVVYIHNGLISLLMFELPNLPILI